MKKALIIIGVLTAIGLGGSSLLKSSSNDTHGIIDTPISPTVEAESNVDDSPLPEPSAPSGDTDSIDYDCADFNSQQEAEEYFISQGGSPSNNIDRLDRDRDGIACEAN